MHHKLMSLNAMRARQQGLRGLPRAVRRRAPWLAVTTGITRVKPSTHILFCYSSVVGYGAHVMQDNTVH